MFLLRYSNTDSEDIYPTKSLAFSVLPLLKNHKDVLPWNFELYGSSTFMLYMKNRYN